MGDWERDAARWLESEQRGDEAAEVSFAQLFAAMPAVEPSAGFVQRTAQAAWDARVRRRRFVAAGFAAAATVVIGAVIFATAGATGWVLGIAGRIAPDALITLLASATTIVEFWTLMARAGSVVARVAVMPEGVAALVTAEVVGGAALYTLHRLLRDELRFRNSGPLCL
jgi:hypothetical protein